MIDGSGGPVADQQALLSETSTVRSDASSGINRELVAVESLHGEAGSGRGRGDDKHGDDDAGRPRVGKPHHDPTPGDVDSTTENPVTSVPEPSVLLLMGIGLSGLAMRQRRRSTR